jgi:CheY-like chemotaxis protein
VRSETRTILLIEDDPNDVFFTKNAFEVANITNSLQVLADGQQGIDYLAGTGKYTDRTKFPFLVLTSSSSIEDIDEAYRLGARSYLVKPRSVEKRVEMARLIKTYWLESNQRPSSPGTQTY